jgi:hypothetical protein
LDMPEMNMMFRVHEITFDDPGMADKNGSYWEGSRINLAVVGIVPSDPHRVGSRSCAFTRGITASMRRSRTGIGTTTLSQMIGFALARGDSAAPTNASPFGSARYKGDAGMKRWVGLGVIADNLNIGHAMEKQSHRSAFTTKALQKRPPAARRSLLGRSH